MVSRRGQFYTNRLGEYVNPYNPQSEALLEGLRQQFSKAEVKYAMGATYTPQSPAPPIAEERTRRRS